MKIIKKEKESLKDEIELSKFEKDKIKKLREKEKIFYEEKYNDLEEKYKYEHESEFLKKFYEPENFAACKGSANYFSLRNDDLHFQTVAFLFSGIEISLFFLGRRIWHSVESIIAISKFSLSKARLEGR